MQSSLTRTRSAAADPAETSKPAVPADELEHLVEHLIQTQGSHAAAVAAGIAASAEASGNSEQRSLWLRVRDAIDKRG